MPEQGESCPFEGRRVCHVLCRLQLVPGVGTGLVLVKLCRAYLLSRGLLSSFSAARALGGGGGETRLVFESR